MVKWLVFSMLREWGVWVCKTGRLRWRFGPFGDSKRAFFSGETVRGAQGNGDCKDFFMAEGVARLYDDGVRLWAG